MAAEPFLGEIMWVSFNFAPKGWAATGSVGPLRARWLSSTDHPGNFTPVSAWQR
jgi:hypothetical protein